MQKALLFLTLFISQAAMAECIGPAINGTCYGTTVDRTNGNTSNYQSNSGSNYQYDMSNPSDRNDYSLDLDAQSRDQLNTNPNRSMDRNSGQYGGGIYD